MIDLADRPDVSPELRLVPHAFREAYGRSAEGVWYAPGVVSVLPGLSVCGRWGAIVAGERRDDGIVELASINKPAEPVVLPSDDVPSWAKPVVQVAERLQPGGATLLCSVDLPAGSGLSSQTALACAAALALRDLCHPSMPLGHLVDVLAQSQPQSRVEAAFAGYEVGVDIAGARLLIVDTRVRRDTPVRLTDYSIRQHGSVEQLGQDLTDFHRAQETETEQDIAVAAALKAGALGATMLVDDPGRPVVALATPDRVAAVRAYVSGAFRRETLTAPRYLTIRPSPGARRVTG
ncbi:GHMP family kinase ATP-binding protein [Kibdelosporangium aridum]|uniref:GHMP family kinase ATP-binding protein n=1 Tax=Kibdelosporangium aridum TaxID=2030 RepID=UPI00068C162F